MWRNENAYSEKDLLINPLIIYYYLKEIFFDIIQGDA